MAIKELRNGYEVWTIEAADNLTRASFVPELGAIGCSLVLPGPSGPRETLFLQDHFWDRSTELTRGGLPFLFPVCGRLERDGRPETYLYDGNLYRLKIHGFAHRLAWRLAAADTGSEIVMTLTDTPATRRRYPFAFALRLTYRVEPGALVCEQQYINRSRRPMPYYAGFHPYFRTPAPRAGKDLVRLNLVPGHFLAYNDRLTDLAGVKPRKPDFPVSITDPAIHEQLIRMGGDKRAQLLFPDGFRLRMTSAGRDDQDMFGYIQLYTLPDKPFFCLEPWMGFPNAMNSVAGARWLAPGATEYGRLRIEAAGSVAQD